LRPADESPLTQALIQKLITKETTAMKNQKIVKIIISSLLLSFLIASPALSGHKAANAKQR
jgi:hypothetical protein